MLYRALFSRLRVLPLYWELKTQRRNLDFSYKVFPGIPKKLLVGQARVINSDDIHLTAAYVEDIALLMARLIRSSAPAEPERTAIPGDAHGSRGPQFVSASTHARGCGSSGVHDLPSSGAHAPLWVRAM